MLAILNSMQMKSQVFNTDCLAAMREMPDNAFDLAVVDPPYGAGFTEGGGCKGWFSKYHEDSSQTVKVERERERDWNRFGGRFDKYKYPLSTEELPKTGRDVGFCELEEHGRRSMQKNYFVGRGAGTGIF